MQARFANPALRRALVAAVALVLSAAMAFFVVSGDEPVQAQTPSLPYATGNNHLVLVDKQHRLSPGYYPRDLNYLSGWGVPSQGTQLLRREASRSLSAMTEDARASDAYMTVSSSFRPYAEQSRLYSYWTSIYGPGAGGISAPPGTSQHQLGTTVDFTNATANYGLNYSFASSQAYSWLMDNAHRYGFVLSYPRGGYQQTGYRYEPWHWRYVGQENATRIVNSGLGLQGYLEQSGFQPYG